MLHVIVHIYEPVRDVAVRHVCLERFLVDSSPPLAGALECPLHGEPAAQLVLPSAPCFSADNASAPLATYFVPSVDAVPVAFSDSFSDEQSEVASVSGISEVVLTPLYPRSAAAASVPDATAVCQAADCASELALLGWQTVAAFGALAVHSTPGIDDVATLLAGSATYTAALTPLVLPTPLSPTPSPPPPFSPAPLIPPLPSPPPIAGVVCSNDCAGLPHGHNGICDDGGPGSIYSFCAFGTSSAPPQCPPTPPALAALSPYCPSTLLPFHPCPPPPL